jgi:hypothetical protein
LKSNAGYGAIPLIVSIIHWAKQMQPAQTNFVNGGYMAQAGGQFGGNTQAPTFNGPNQVLQAASRAMTTDELLRPATELPISDSGRGSKRAREEEPEDHDDDGDM